MVECLLTTDIDMPGSRSYRSRDYIPEYMGQAWYADEKYRTPMRDRYRNQQNYANEMRRGAEQEMVRDAMRDTFTPKKGWGDFDEAFMDFFGDGEYHSGNIGGVDRNMDSGVMNEYMGMGDYGALGGSGRAMGEQMGAGNHRISKHGGLAPSSIYNMDPNYDKYMNKTVHYDQDANLWNMYMHPYDAERWGDYLPGSDEERKKLADRNRFRPGGAGGNASEMAGRIIDRIRRRF